ncbi:MAG TPA: AmmeMemoRadiSam system protein A [Thermodesulfobacteriota bacterium]|nr:AmmeMemoRadiSam system protein A [Thermodesulfobacteriota bacterium]
MPLTQFEKETLLKIARSSIEAFVRDNAALEVDIPSPTLFEDAGAFVSIHKGGRLRGCIGTFASPEPLYITVRDMAVAACSRDPRFVPVEECELDNICIEISVLSPLREITDISEIEVGRHGLFITKERWRGVLLPQVAVEYGFDREKFLEETCLKAGLETCDWKEGAKIFVFEAEIIKEDGGDRAHPKKSPAQ